MNVMKTVRIEKLTLNVGAGTNQELLKKGMKLLHNLTGVEPIKTISDKRIPNWGVRPGLPVGCKISLRKQELILPLIKRLIAAKENKLKKSCFDAKGNVSFGIHEYINVPELAYDPSIGIMGFQVCITLYRAGYRVKTRRKFPAKVGKSHVITQDEAIELFKEKFHVILEEE